MSDRVRSAALASTLAVGVGVATACQPPPPPPSSPCQSVGAAAAPPAPVLPPPPGPLGPGAAADLARRAVAASGQRTAGGKIPLVTIERDGGRPVIRSTAVGSADEAATVAATAASGSDLVSVEVDTPVRAVNHIPSDDTLRYQQWSLDKVNFEDSWASASVGGSGQVVAVIDTGVHAGHPDLTGQVLAGQYFLHSDDGSAAFSGSGGTTDDNGHGTHVAGIVAAVANNATGITGAAPGVQVKPVKVLCADGTGWDSDVANGVTWATDNGATVINLSLGSTQQSAALQAAVQYARSRGVFVVAAAGNGGAGSPPSYPGAYPEVIAVGATTNTAGNTRAFYSTTGSYLDLAAPGGSGTGNYTTQIESTWNDGGYRVASGTSMASPHVAAAAALVRAAHPAYTPLQVCTQLIRAADDLGAAGVDVEYGYGLVDPLEGVGATLASGPSCA